MAKAIKTKWLKKKQILNSHRHLQFLIHAIERHGSGASNPVTHCVHKCWKRLTLFFTIDSVNRLLKELTTDKSAICYVRLQFSSIWLQG